jgi:competence protein ComEC
MFAIRFRRWLLLVIACIGIFTGLIVAHYAACVSVWPIWIVLPVVLLTARKQNIATAIFLFVFCFGLGWWRGDIYMHYLAMHGSFHDQKVVIVGRATEDAVYGKQSQLEFSMDTLRAIEPKQVPLVGSLTIRGFGESMVYRGDEVQVYGKLYPTRGNNLASIGYAQLRVLRRDHSWVNDLRRRFASGMLSALPEPAASFGLGLLIGQRNTLPEDISTQLQAVGLTHVIAVSGYNLTIIVMTCRRLFIHRSKFQATAVCLGLIGLFLLLTGLSPPIVRAGVISVISIGLWYYGRELRPVPLLLLAAAATAFANPLYLWGNVSWYLSFLAFFGVLVLAPLLTRRLMGAKEPHMLLGIVIESICANMAVMPYVLYVFGATSLVSLPANLLVVPCIPLAMLLATVAGLVGWLLPAAAGWFALPAKVLLTYLLDVASILSRVPHAFVQGIGFSAWQLAASYICLVVLCIVLWVKIGKRGIVTEKKQRAEGV